MRPSHIGLAHELIHADHNARGVRISKWGPLNRAWHSHIDSSGNTKKQFVKKTELKTVGLGNYNTSADITENDIRGEQGLNLRAAYISY